MLSPIFFLLYLILLIHGYLTVTGVLFLGLKRPGREAVPPLLQYVLMAWCLIKAEGQFYL